MPNIISGSYGSNVTLYSESVDQWENTDITLTCTYNGPYSGSFTWNLTSSQQYSAYVESNCIVRAKWLANPTEYSYICTNDKVHSVTLKNITQTRHGETWQCGYNPGEFLTMSNAVQIFVQGIKPID